MAKFQEGSISWRKIWFGAHAQLTQFESQVSCPRFLSSPPDLEGQGAAAGAVTGLLLPPLDAE